MIIRRTKELNSNENRYDRYKKKFKMDKKTVTAGKKRFIITRDTGIVKSEED